MKRSDRISILAGLILLFTWPVSGQHFLHTDGQAIVNENQDTILLRGMGLGGWMVQEGYMLQTAGFANPQHEIRATIEALIGPAATDEFYEAWLANHVRKSDIDSLQAWGFNSVRLPMHYNLFTLPIEEEPVPGENTWLDKGFELTDSLISWCRQNEMYVILDLHAAPGGQGYDAGISDYDDSKPSLWESQENRDKMVALWQRLAERYKDEDRVAGYDLLNEPNWNLPGNVALRNLYEEVTDSIRAVGDEHILFIEGNWFANDFTGLTPPWDDNLVYSPHKYWSNNDVATMQWVLDLRNTHNVPLFLGESGENSNVWFRDAIRLLEDLDIGWAWWPMKKVESISGPLSVVKTEAYQALLDYWSGNGPMPAPGDAAATLMDLAEGLRSENCVFQKDVIDAMFRQVYSGETVPYQEHTLPGLIYATDFDMGVIGQAYYDTEAANYQVSTGNFTAWNSGWMYRNDGVDIEACADDVSSNGFNVGFTETGEWMQYTVNVEESGVYDIHLRGASGGSGGRLHFQAGGAAVTGTAFVPPTGGWQNWETVIIPNVILDESDQQIRLYIDAAGLNVSSFEFIETGIATTEVPARFMAAVTLDEHTIQMSVNKFMNTPIPAAPAGFEIVVDGSSVPVNAVTVDPVNPRKVNFSVDYLLRSTETIEISYSGSDLQAFDGTSLQGFTLEEVRNTLFFVHQLPGRIEAEDYFFQSGVELEQTTDLGGGQNIAFLDPGDYLDYEINVTASGTYQVGFRTSSLNDTGGLEMELIDAEGHATALLSSSFPPTGGWQNWMTSSENVELPAGRHTLRVRITQSEFNINWFDYALITSATEPPAEGWAATIKVYPNPSAGLFQVHAELATEQDLYIEVVNLGGQTVLSRRAEGILDGYVQIDLTNAPDGFYWIVIRLEDGTLHSEKLVKTGY